MNLKSRLSEAVETKELYSVFEQKDLEGGYTGILLNVTEEELLLKKINRDGREDGYFLMRTEDVVCCCTGDSELERRRKLWRGKEEKGLLFSAKSDSLMDGLLSYAAKKMEPVGICCQEQAYTGWLREFSDEMVVLNEVTSYGENDGEVWLRRDCIDTVEADSQELRIRKNMWSGEIPETRRNSEKDFFEKLKAYEGKNGLFEFYLDDDLEMCYVGEVEHVTEKELMIKHIDARGNYDGHGIFPLNRVVCIYRKSRYLSKMEKLRKDGLKGNSLYMEGEDLSGELMRYVQREQEFIMLEVEEQEYYGKIIDWDENQIQLAVLDPYGKQDGRMWILREWVKAIWIDNGMLQGMILFKNQNSPQEKAENEKK